MPLLEVKDLYKSFGNVKVLNGINLTLEPGKIYTLRGDNGSGKTTLLNILSGFMMPDRGSVQFNGQELVGMKPHAISRLGIKRTFQDLRIIRDMTLAENIQLSLDSNSIISKKQKNRIDEVLEILHMGQYRDVLASHLSYGQLKLLTLGCAIVDTSSLLLLDEPSSGLGVQSISYVLSLEKKMKGDGKTILQVEHDLDFIDETSDKVFTLEKGQLHVVR